LRDSIDAGRFVKVADAVEQRQLDAGHPGEAGVALHLTDEFRLVDLRECLGTLIEKLQAVTTQVEVAQLARDDDLEDLGGLMRRAVESCRAQQRNAVIDPLMLHQRVDPLHGVRRAGDLVFRAQDEIEAVPGVRQAALVDRARERCGQCRRSGPAQRLRHLGRSRLGRA